MQNSKTDTSSTASSSRRRWLGWTLASVAAGAAGVAGWRQFGPRQAPVPEAVAGVPERWLTHAFAQPGQIGTRTLESFQGKPLLINLWATWCPPCIEEMPELARFAARHEFRPHALGPLLRVLCAGGACLGACLLLRHAPLLGAACGALVYAGVLAGLKAFGPHDLAELRSTGLIEFLQARDVTTVLVGGLATDYCVKTSVLQLRRAGFRVIVHLDACRGIAPETIDQARTRMIEAGAELAQTLADIQRLLDA